MRLLHAAAALGIAAFILVCGAAQFLRTDLDWIAAPLSFYLIGPGGAAVKAAYVACLPHSPRSGSSSMTPLCRLRAADCRWRCSVCRR